MRAPWWRARCVSRRIRSKSTIARQDGGYIVTIKSGYHYYTSHQVDFFAIYVIPEDVWYILPAQTTPTPPTTSPPPPRRSPQKYEPYKEAWHLLKTGCHGAFSVRRWTSRESL